MNKLQELAKKLYFDKVLSGKFRNNFLDKLPVSKVIDKSTEGHYCASCGKIIETPVAYSTESTVVFPRDYEETKEIWIIKTHYDGCRGWE